MGITGLIPFLEKSSKRGNISQFSGCTVAVDTYCWLHKGAFSCAEKLAMGQPTDAYVRYCMKFVDMLLANKIKPILVFDGCHLPAKAETEIKRSESREINRKRAAELIAMGQAAQGRNLLRRSIDITHEMALELIKRCHERNVDCIVAPYEADAQLAYLNISGIADVVITEDSDLTLFGCTKIFFKMDLNGCGLLVEQDRLHLAMNLRSDHFDIEKFRHMCILSGCDYLASLPGIGLQKACKFVLKNTDTDIHRALCRLGSYLNMKSLVVTPEYRDSFMRALVTFKHQLVFCPLQRKQVRLTPPTDEVTEEQLHHAGDEKPEQLAWDLALGNCNPLTLKKCHNYNPDTYKSEKQKTNAWSENNVAKHVSIWSKDFKVQKKNTTVIKDQTTKWPETSNKVMVLNTNDLKCEIGLAKRSYDELANDLTENEMIQLYGRSKIQKCEKPIKNMDLQIKEKEVKEEEIKEVKIEEEEIKEELIENTPPSSPNRNKNPFLKKANSIERSPCLVTGRRRKNFRTLIAFQPTVIDNDIVVKSKFFSSNDECTDAESKATIIPETLDIDLPCTPIDEYKENDAHLNIIEKYVQDCDEIMKRSDSGVDMKDDIDEDELGNVKKSNEEIEIEVIMDNRKLFVPKEGTSANNSETLNKMDCDIISSSKEIKIEENVEDMSDYVVNNMHVNSVKSSFFKWTNTEPSRSPNSSINTNVMGMNKKKQSFNQVKTSVRKQSMKKTLSTPTSSQQKSLNMYGFQRKASDGL